MRRPISLLLATGAVGAVALAQDIQREHPYSGPEEGLGTGSHGYLLLSWGRRRIR